MKRLSPSLLLGTLLALPLASPLHAGVTLDGTLGRSGPLAGPSYAITADLGKQYGGNLFQSFSRFDLVKGETATFSGPASVTAIISRVTGGSPSSIDGTIASTIPGASLYFVNPAGVIFGPNASLDVGGSFHVSTADYLKLGSDGRFDASTPGNSLLTVSPPSAFGFVSAAPAGVTVQNSRLAVPEGQTLSIVAGDITMVNDDPEKSLLSAPGGAVNLVSVGSPGEAVITADGFDTSGFARMGTISLTNTSPGTGIQADVDTSSSVDDAGRITVIGGSLYLDGASLTSTGDSYAPVSTTTRSAITIDMRDTVVLTNQAGVYTNTYSPLDGGAIAVSADRLVVDRDSGIVASTWSETSRSGPIAIRVGSLELKNGGFVEASSWYGGDGGDIAINASRSVSITGYGASATSVYPFSGIYSEALLYGNAGNIAVTTPTLTLDNLGTISTSTINSGNAGNITISAGTLSLTGGAQITSASSQNSGSDAPGGRGGTITVNLTGQMTADGTGSYSGYITGDTEKQYASGVSVSTSTPGDAGSIVLTTPGSVTLRNGGRIDSTADSQSTGAGGHIAITAGSFTGNGGTVTSATGGSGPGGDITLTATGIDLTDGATLSTTSSGTGNAGNLTIAASDHIRLDNAGITAAAANAGGGNITIDPTLVDLRNSQVTTSVRSGSGNGGNIALTAGNLVVDHSAIIATADAGNGGNITLTSPTIVPSGSGSVISASSRLGIAGRVSLSSPLTDLGAGLADLPNTLMPVTLLTPRRCPASDEEASSFTVREQNGSVFAPRQPLVTY